MEALRNSSSPRFWIFALALTHWCSISSIAGCMFTISNHCSQAVWPGTLAGAGTPQLSTTGFRLDPGQSVQVPAPTGWSGRMWARTGCVFDAGGNGKCQTGDCGGRMECAGTGATPPATLFEITLGKGAAAGDMDYYDVSLVDGYNLPVVAVPRTRQGGGCNATGCMADLNRSCPKELQVDIGGSVVACRSACEAFGQDQYCCSGAYATPTTCRPTAYSSIFKSACPRAYSYAYDDGSSTFTCTAADYTIAFCLPPTGLRTPDGQSTGGGTAAGNTPPPPPTDGNGAGSTSQPPPAANNGSSSNGTPPPPTATDSNGAGSTSQLPPAANSGSSSNGTPPPPTATDSNGAGSTSQPPPAADSGSSSNGTPPPPTATDSNGAGSTSQPPPAADSGSSSNGTPPPPTDNNGAGSFGQPPPTTSGGAGGIYQQPWMMPSSASARRNDLWLLLTAVLLLLS